MVTFFDVLRGLLAAGAAAAGGYAGASMAGPWTAAVGAVIGLFAGWMVGKLPLIIGVALVRGRIARMSNAELEARLEPEYYLSHLLLAELAERGQPLQKYRGGLLAAARSSDADRQRFARANLRRWFVDGEADSPDGWTDTSDEQT